MTIFADILIPAVTYGPGSMIWDLVISVCLFAAVATLILGVFAQQSKIQVSAQREAALATGHTDRRTVFEQPVLQPIMWLLLAISHRLALPRAKQWLRQRLTAAGSPNYYTAEEYLAVSVLTGLVMGIVLELLYLFSFGQFSILVIAVGLAGGIFVRLYKLHDTASKRVSEISKRLPYTLDLIAMAMAAGATFTEAVKSVVRDDTTDPLNVELRSVIAEIELGSTRRKALRNLSDRIPLELLRSIVASVIQAEELGTPLHDVLHSEANLLRLRRSVRAENAAAVASVRILIPSLLILMSVVLAVFAPAIIRMIRGGMF